jgi:hypothetical protein
MSDKRFPPGWDEHRGHRVLDHYEAQDDEEAVAEDEAAFESTTCTVMEVLPVGLVPVVHELIVKREVRRPGGCRPTSGCTRRRPR